MAKSQIQILAMKTGADVCVMAKYRVGSYRPHDFIIIPQYLALNHVKQEKAVLSISPD